MLPTDIKSFVWYCKVACLAAQLILFPYTVTTVHWELFTSQQLQTTLPKTLNAALPIMQYLSHIYILDLLSHHITVIR
jgi:hypothetical protein